MSKEILVRFPDEDHLAVALGYESKEEMLAEHKSVEKAVEAMWDDRDFGGAYCAKVVKK